MGVTQSEYLATANKMGALFQGSGLDVQKSAELTEQAMQRAADMKSVMGIDIQMARDSVAGAAKENFTMMDNLGVAMNATTIETMRYQRARLCGTLHPMPKRPKSLCRCSLRKPNSMRQL